MIALIYDKNVYFSKFVSVSSRQGLRNRSHTRLVKACSILRQVFNVNPLDVIEKAIKTARPLLSVRGKRHAGTIRSLPCYLPAYSSNSLAVRWIIEGANLRLTEKTFSEKLAAELFEVFKGSGYAIHKRDALHQLALSNRAFVSKIHGRGDERRSRYKVGLISARNAVPYFRPQPKALRLRCFKI